MDDVAKFGIRRQAKSPEVEEANGGQFSQPASPQQTCN
jgi:hypothetical protein